nr:TonB-dependent receptor plug domain-containing protein [Pseudomonas sp. ALS1131]
MNTKPSSRRSRLSRLSLLAAGIMLASTLHAQDATYVLNLPAQPLDKALNVLAGQTGSRILFATEIAADQQAPALSSELTLQQALQRLLQGTGLTVQETGDGSYVIAEPASAGAALNLGAITIQGQGMGEATEGSGSYTTGLVSVGSKTPVSLKETPQTVSIISQQMIEDQRITTLPEAMKRAPGITVRNNNYHVQQFYSRGFGIDNVQIDGASPMDIGTGLGTFYSDRLSTWRPMTTWRCCVAPAVCWVARGIRVASSTWCASGHWTAIS